MDTASIVNYGDDVQAVKEIVDQAFTALSKIRGKKRDVTEMHYRFNSLWSEAFDETLTMVEELPSVTKSSKRSRTSDVLPLPESQLKKLNDDESSGLSKKERVC